MSEHTRRQFFSTAGGVAAGCAALCACHTNKARLMSRPAQGGTVSFRLAEAPELARPGGVIKLKSPVHDDPLLVWRDAAGGIRVNSIECTHFGCDVEVAAGGTHLYCPCHGSEYESTGAVRKGPAKKPLRRFRVERRGDDIVVSAA